MSPPRASVLSPALQEGLLTSALGVLVSGQFVPDKKGQGWEAGRPLPAVNRGYSLVAVGGILTVVASSIAEHGL